MNRISAITIKGSTYPPTWNARYIINTQDDTSMTNNFHWFSWAALVKCCILTSKSNPPNPGLPREPIPTQHSNKPCKNTQFTRFTKITYGKRGPNFWINFKIRFGYVTLHSTLYMICWCVSTVFFPSLLEYYFHCFCYSVRVFFVQIVLFYGGG